MGKYHSTIGLLFYWFGISCMTTDNFCFYLQNRLIQASQTGGQWYIDTSPFSIPWHGSCEQSQSGVDAIKLFYIQSTYTGGNWPKKSISQKCHQGPML
jgi:hypothetical protein